MKKKATFSLAPFRQYAYLAEVLAYKVVFLINNLDKGLLLQPSVKGPFCFPNFSLLKAK